MPSAVICALIGISRQPVNPGLANDRTYVALWPLYVVVYPLIPDAGLLVVPVGPSYTQVPFDDVKSSSRVKVPVEIAPPLLQTRRVKVSMSLVVIFSDLLADFCSVKTGGGGVGDGVGV